MFFFFQYLFAIDMEKTHIEYRKRNRFHAEDVLKRKKINGSSHYNSASATNDERQNKFDDVDAEANFTNRRKNFKTKNKRNFSLPSTQLMENQSFVFDIKFKSKWNNDFL